MKTKKTTYFEKAGEENTDECIKAVSERLKEGDIKYVVVATSTGKTALKLAEKVHARIVCVTYNAGFKEEYTKKFDLNIPKLDAAEIDFVRATHALSAGERSVNSKYQGGYPLLVIADTLRMLSQGAKVAVEASLMATDAGKVPAKSKIIAIGGAGHGCDTALVLQNTYSHKVLQELAVQEVVCLAETTWH